MGTPPTPPVVEALRAPTLAPAPAPGIAAPGPGPARRPRPRPLTLEEIEAHFHLPVEAACRKLGVSRPTIARVLRKNGISRWPYRAVAAKLRRATGEGANTPPTVTAAAALASALHKSHSPPPPPAPAPAAVAAAPAPNADIDTEDEDDEDDHEHEREHEHKPTEEVAPTRTPTPTATVAPTSSSPADKVERPKAEPLPRSPTPTPPALPHIKDIVADARGLRRVSVTVRGESDGSLCFHGTFGNHIAVNEEEKCLAFVDDTQSLAAKVRRTRVIYAHYNTQPRELRLLDARKQIVVRAALPDTESDNAAARHFDAAVREYGNEPFLIRHN